jgi:hypothetical protein
LRKKGGTVCDRDSHYPKDLKDAEADAVGKRRDVARVPDGCPAHDSIGLALSGGGIRSATFSLGILQALAKYDLLRKIDYLSTVSGGGYIGSFLGALYSRRRRSTPHDATASVRTALASHDSAETKWLRENGRYLCPNGASDSRFAIAVTIRNWCAVMTVLSLFLLAVFLCGASIRQSLWTTSWYLSYETWLACIDCPRFWPSPLLALFVATFALGVVPLGWAYWFAQRIRSRWSWMPLCGSVFVGLGSAACVWKRAEARQIEVAALVTWDGFQLSFAIVSVVAWMAIIYWLLASRGGRHSNARVASARNRLSRWLSTTLVNGMGLLGIALVDTLGQTIYAATTSTARSCASWNSIASALASLVPIVAAARTLVKSLADDDGDKKREKVSLKVVAGILAFVIVVVLLTSVDICGHAILWRGEVPSPWATQGATMTAPTRWVWGALGAAALLSLLSGQVMSFLNQSSHQELYGGRLTRAYLGASNPARTGPAGENVSMPIDGDDISFSDYRPNEAGGPLHIINMTLNETVEGRSEIEQRDRKGMVMAIGPCGISVAARHHAMWKDPEQPPMKRPSDSAENPEQRETNAAAKKKSKERHSIPVKALPTSTPFKVFPTDGDGIYMVEALGLGRWIGISGAAFSTALGVKTSLAFSVLAGLANVRLGYWWDSGIRRHGQAAKTVSGTVLYWATKAFPVQIQLIEEFLARFHGAVRRRWYLTDGGHFENTGCYELIRRKARFIVCCDDGADPEYGFEDIATLIRLARTDFRAEIEVLGTDALKTYGLENSEFVGTLAEVQRSLTRAGATSDAVSGHLQGGSYSSKHALLASVRFENDSKPSSFILFIKPSVTGDEPLDVQQYQVSHPSFPQEPTSDQFFDEAQWESYRQLGYHIGEKLFAASNGDRWYPATLAPPNPVSRDSVSP